MSIFGSRSMGVRMLHGINACDSAAISFNLLRRRLFVPQYRMSQGIGGSERFQKIRNSKEAGRAYAAGKWWDEHPMR